MKKFGFDLDDTNYKGRFYTMYTGAIYSVCGNFSSLDFNPDNNFEKIVKN